MMRRRRPLLRAAAVGGGAYMAGKHRANSQAEQAQYQQDQDARISNLEAQQQQPSYQQAPPAPEPPRAGRGAIAHDRPAEPAGGAAPAGHPVRRGIRRRQGQALGHLRPGGQGSPAAGEGILVGRLGEGRGDLLLGAAYLHRRGRCTPGCAARPWCSKQLPQPAGSSRRYDRDRRSADVPATATPRAGQLRSARSLGQPTFRNSRNRPRRCQR